MNDTVKVVTPGPWKVEPAVPGEASGVHVFAVNPKGSAEDGDLITIADFIENEANARLIAAAPDLYHAIKSSMEYLEEQLGDCDEGCECIMHDLRAAIARAEGR